jgi:uncharacterized integral membrane protein
MPLRTLLLLLIVAAIAVFVAVNWTAFTTPTSLSLVFGAVEAPLGLVMLAITGALALVFLAYAFYLQGSALRESRRMARELAAQRELAQAAEASRLTELRAHIDQAVNGLAAQIAELDDRLGSGRSVIRSTTGSGPAGM